MFQKMLQGGSSGGGTISLDLYNRVSQEYTGSITADQDYNVFICLTWDDSITGRYLIHNGINYYPIENTFYVNTTAIPIYVIPNVKKGDVVRAGHNTNYKFRYLMK